MCGIVGSWLLESQRFAQTARDIEPALDALAHRGPDDRGVWNSRDRRVLLGHRRLSILDLSAAGKQPMQSTDADDELVVVFNGEIYNYRELKTDLASRGCSFRSSSDTEVLIAAYHHWGLDFLDRLRGMFALAIWDARQNRLVLARDRAGKKPLYYTVNRDGLFFASELGALRALTPNAGRALDRDALDAYLTLGCIPGERTIFQDVFELPPGTAAVCDSPGNMTRKRYWQVDWSHSEDVTLEEAVEETDRRLREAVKLRMRSDVPVGAFLSGGIDSGLITAMAAELTDQPLTTLCIGSEETELDERPLARLVAERYGTRHHEIVVRPDVRQLLPGIARRYGEPFADASAVPSYLVSQAAAEHCTVVLNGDGGDELFCGYRRHVAAQFLQRIGRWTGGRVGAAAGRALLKALPRPQGHRTRYALGHRFLRCLTARGAERTLVFSSDGFNQGERQSLYADGYEAKSPRAILATAFERLEGLDSLTTMLAFDFESSLPDALLVKMDIASMAHSIEARSPLLDQEVIEWAFSLPNRVKLPGRETKPVLRRLAERYLPREIIHAPKRGFEIPVRRWLEEDLRELRDDLLLSRSGLVAQLFDRKALERLLSPSGRASTSSSRWGQLVWSLLMLGLWDQECWS